MSIFTVLPAYAKQVAHFKHNYQGLQPGFSSVKTMKQKLGKPLKVKKTSNGKNYIYQKVVINFSGKDASKINTITIYKDAAYKDVNGLRLGDNIYKAAKKLGVKKVKKAYLVDNNKGVIYWHKHNRISKIVLPFSFYMH